MLLCGRYNHFNGRRNKRLENMFDILLAIEIQYFKEQHARLHGMRGKNKSRNKLQYVVLLMVCGRRGEGSEVGNAGAWFKALCPHPPGPASPCGRRGPERGNAGAPAQVGAAVSATAACKP